jgi:hypothetical protein
MDGVKRPVGGNSGNYFVNYSQFHHLVLSPTCFLRTQSKSRPDMGQTCLEMSHFNRVDMATAILRVDK